jgi:hypothetical protein
VDCSQTDLQEPAGRFGSCDLWTMGAAGETNSIDVVEAHRQGGLRAAVIKRSQYADAQTLTDRIRGVFLAECDAAVVDCTTDDDLVTVAIAHRLLEFQSLLVGSAGLAAGVVNSLPDVVRGTAPSHCCAGSAHPYQSGGHRWPAKNHQRLAINRTTRVIE